VVEASQDRRRESLDKKFVVARTRDIPEGARMLVTVQGREIGVFNVNGKFHAVLNRCPHRGGELCKGDVLGFVHADQPGAVTLDKSKQLIVCPWHGWEFDIETGQSWYDAARNTDPAMKLPSARAFGTTVEPGAQLAGELKGDTAEVSERQGRYVDPQTHRVVGPYTADIIPVQVEDDYVVISFRRVRR
jgi:nitrite reductase/ring-hydroxylating ferredoxin subunit